MKIVAFDTETRGLDWFDPAHAAFMGSWAGADGEWSCLLNMDDEAGQQALWHDLTTADVIVCHNLSFDTHMIREAIGLDLLTLDVELHDTDIMSRVLFPEGQRKGERGGHGLKNLATVWVDPAAKSSEEEMEQKATEAGITLRSTGGYYDTWCAFPDVVEHYARMDARYTYDLFIKFTEELAKNENAQTIYALEREVLPILILAEKVGVRLDPTAVGELTDEYEQRRDELHARLSSELGEEALGGPGSESALREALLSVGIPLTETTETGELATNAYALSKFTEDFPVIDDLQEWRKVNKFLTTYLGAMDGRDTLHTSFRQVGAWTGRMSTARPNTQNMPKRAGKEVRRVFIPRPGHVFLVYDYEGIEHRLLAYYLGPQGEPLREMIRNGFDAHADMAVQLDKGAHEYGYYCKQQPGQPIRDKAKNTTYAIIYGAGGPRVTAMNNLDPGPPAKETDWVVVNGYKEVGDPTYAEAKALIKDVKKAIPGFFRLDQRIKKKIQKEGHVTTLLGRYQPVGKDKEYVGLNALIQGSAADIMKQGVVNVNRVVKDHGGTVLLVIHDEVVVEVPEDKADELAPRVAAALESAYPLDPPLSVEGGVVTTNYADA